MTHDYAKVRSRPPPTRALLPLWLWFFSGFASGAFIVFLAMLAKIDPDSTAPNTTRTSIQSPATNPGQAGQQKKEWSFYDFFTNNEVPVDDRPTQEQPKPRDVADGHTRLLQVGSFGRREDADARRAALLLMGFADTSIQPAEVNGETRYRVMVGPFDTALARDRAQDRLAQEGISTLPITIVP